jgi:hypothetical protein
MLIGRVEEGWEACDDVAAGRPMKLLGSTLPDLIIVFTVE